MIKALNAKRSTKTREQPTKLQLVVSEHDLIARSGAKVTRISLQEGTERAVVHGELANPRLLTAAVKQAAAELGATKANAAVSLPSQLFAIHTGDQPVPTGTDAQAVIENNLDRIYSLREHEFGSTAYIRETTDEHNWRVIYVTAERSKVAAFSEAIAAAGIKVQSIEPQITAEMRAIASLRPGMSISVISLEDGMARASEILDGELVTSQSVNSFENAMLGISPDLRDAIRRVASGQVSLLESNQGPQASQELLNIQSQNANYSQSLWQRSDTPAITVLTGELNVPNMAEVFNDDLMLTIDPIEPSEYVGNLAAEGLAMRSRSQAVTLAINLNTREEKKSGGPSPLAPYIGPIAVAALAIGSYAYGMLRQNTAQAKVDSLTAERAALQPKVANQLSLQQANKEMSEDITRAEQTKTNRAQMASYIQAIVDRIPNADQVGITMLAPSINRIDKRAFNEKPVDTLLTINVQGVNQQALLEFIKAFEQAPFSISVDSISPISNNRPERVLRADIGMNKAEMGSYIQGQKPKDPPATGAFEQPAPPTLEQP